MNTNSKSVHRWPLIVSYVGIITLMMACMGIAVGATNVEAGTLQIDDGVVEVKNEDGDWVPVAGSATFELVGELESTDPWTVAGTELETNASTQIADGLEVGDLVRVQGAVLEDDTWVAYSIALAEEPTDPIIVLIGIVDSVDPWQVNGIELNVTDETDIQGEIAAGALVRVEILLRPDGPWEVLSITLLSETSETSGCATVVATVVSVSGNEIQFLGWPTTITLETGSSNANDQVNDNSENGEDDEGEDTEEDDDNEIETGDVIAVGQVVSAVICVSDDGNLVIVQIIILNTNDTDNDSGGIPTEGEKVLVCHKPNKNAHTLSLPPSAVPAHLGHGDILGPCP